MEYVKIEKTSTGYLLDPNCYLDWLDESSDLLPDGAMAFATDPGHYDVHSPRCVKDLRLVRAVLRDGQEGVSAEILLGVRDSDRKGWEIQYSNVAEFSVSSRYGDIVNEADFWKLGKVQLDEILPHKEGCRHEIQLLDGVIVVVAADIDSIWVEN